MRWGLLVSLCLVTLAGAAQAALPPQYQRQREFQAILESPGVVDGFPAGQLITAVTYVAPDRFRVSTANCSMIVAIADDTRAPAMPGSRRFVVRLSKPTCSKAR